MTAMTQASGIQSTYGNGDDSDRSSGQDAPCSNLRMIEAEMATGTVKWFSAQKGYGFIQPDNGTPDVFVHITAVEKAGLSSLSEGQTVSYEVVENRGRSAADNLRVG